MELLLNKIRIVFPKLDMEKALAMGAMLITVTFWGISFISIKIAVSEIPPLTMALIRFAIATAILLIILKKIEPKSKLHKQDLLRMVFAGILGVTVYFYFENTGVKLTTASSASLIISMIPIVSIIVDILFFKTKLPPITIVGVLVAVTGTYFVVTANGNIDFSSSAFRGNLFMIGAALSWVVYTMLTKTFTHNYSGLFVTCYQNLYGMLFLIPVSLLEYRQWHAFSLKAFANILFLAVCCSAMGYFLYIYALRRLEVTVTTLYLNLIPVVGVISGYLILKESILPIQLFGGAIIIAGIFIVNFSKKTSNS